MLNYTRIIVGEMGTNCYLLYSSDKTAIIIDPGDEGTEIAQIVAEMGLSPMAILLTHGHFDHILGVLDLQLIFNIPVAMGKEDIFLVNRAKETAEYFLKKKIKAPKIAINQPGFRNIKKIKLGDETIEIIKTPGHTPGGTCFYAPKSGLLFTGDTVFKDGMWGETTHQYSSEPELRKSIEKLMKLPDSTKILSGHGDEGTVAQEKKYYLN